MSYITGCDAHKHYSQFAVLDEDQTCCKQVRVEHERGAIRDSLSEFPEGTPVALESIGNWYWIVDEIEQAGCKALLTHPGKANINPEDEIVEGQTSNRREILPAKRNTGCHPAGL